MSQLKSLDGRGLYRWAVRAVRVLTERRAEINALNVFPVPDSDTGSNMAFTMEAALAAARGIEVDDRADVVVVARALATGSVRGARGNSGVVLSQVLRGMAEAVTQEPFDGKTISDALNIAVRLVNSAISDPVEGTVVTVLRAAAGAAKEAVGDNKQVVEVARAATDAARTALARTPSQLTVLRDAGVVDAGGMGLVVLLDTMLAELSGVSEDVTDEPVLAEESHGTPGYLEAMFLFTAPPETVDELESVLTELGDSLLVARGEGEAQFHIHSTDAGKVIETAYSHGRVSGLRLEVLPEQSVVDKPSRILLALTPPGAIAELYRGAGAEVVEVPGDEDVVGEVLSVIRRTRAGEVVLLPNGLLSRRELVAVDNSTRALEQSITLLPTSRLVSGIAALTMHDPAQPLATATYEMGEAASSMRTAVLRRAPKAALTTAGPCAKGDILAEVHGDVLVVADDVASSIETTAGRLLDAGGEQLTVLTEEIIDGEALSERLGVEVVVFDGSGMASTGVIAEIGVE